MTIKYCYDKVQKKYGHSVERAANDSFLHKTAGGGTCVGGFSSIFSPLCCAVAKNISLEFSAATARDISVTKITGRGIIKGLNDLLYIKADGASPQEIVLDAGFYATGALLAAEIKDKLDNNEAFVDGGLTPFTVTFNTAASTFTIAPAAHAIQYLDINVRKPVRRFSTAGCVIGFNENTTLSASITGDPVYDVGTSAAILTKTGATTLTELVVEDIAMDEDQAISISTSDSAITMKSVIDYVKLDHT